MLRSKSWSSAGTRLVRRAIIDAVIGFAVFVGLAFSVSIDRTGGVGEFTDIGQFVSSRANAAEIGSPVNRSIGRNVVIVEGNNTHRTNIVRKDTPGANDGIAFARINQTSAMVLLGLIFSTVIAFKLAFLRHLRAVYGASSRRRHAHTFGPNGLESQRETNQI